MDEQQERQEPQREEEPQYFRRKHLPPEKGNGCGIPALEIFSKCQMTYWLWAGWGEPY